MMLLNSGGSSGATADAAGSGVSAAGSGWGEATWDVISKPASRNGALHSLKHNGAAGEAGLQFFHERR